MEPPRDVCRRPAGPPDNTLTASLGAITSTRTPKVPDLPVDCNIPARRRRRRRLSGGTTQTGQSGSRTALVCPSPAHMAARHPSDPTDLSLQTAHGDGYTWVGEDESYGTDRCSRASYRLSRSCETVEQPRDAAAGPRGRPRYRQASASAPALSAANFCNGSMIKLVYSRAAWPTCSFRRHLLYTRKSESHGSIPARPT